MWWFFLIVSILGVIAALIHVVLEFNSLDKQFRTLVGRFREHYGSE